MAVPTVTSCTPDAGYQNDVALDVIIAGNDFTDASAVVFSVVHTISCPTLTDPEMMYRGDCSAPKRDWADARDGLTADVMWCGSAITAGWLCIGEDPPKYTVQRTWIDFDSSAVLAEATIKSAKIHGTGYNPGVMCVVSAPAGAAAVGQFDEFGATIYGSAVVGSSGSVDIDLDAAGIALIVAEGTTRFGFREDIDISNTAPLDLTHNAAIDNVTLEVTLEEDDALIIVNGFSVDTDEQITVNIDIDLAALTGLRNISVTTPGGTGKGTDVFTVDSVLPQVDYVSPEEARQGAIWLGARIEGSFFTGVTDVDFGDDITVTNIVEDSDNIIFVDIEVGIFAEPGLRDVGVTTPAGLGSMINGFLVTKAVSPEIDSITPDQGKCGQARDITILGSYLYDTSVVDFGAGITVISFDIDSDDEITAQIEIDSDAALGYRDVEITTPGGSDQMPDGFYVYPVALLDVFVSHNVTPFISAYPVVLSPDGEATGFGLKYANPAILPVDSMFGGATGVAYNPVSCDVAVSHTGTPYVSVYPWIPGTGFGAKYANPGTLPVSLGWCVAFCGSDIAVGTNSSPCVQVYPWTSGAGGISGGFGVKYDNPSVLPLGAVKGVAFCGNTDISVVHAGVPRIDAWPWTPGVGFGVKYADPGGGPPSSGISVAFRSDTDIILGHQNGSGVPYLGAWPWLANRVATGIAFGTKYAQPATEPASRCVGVAFGTYDVAAIYGVDPFISVWPWTPGTGGADGGFGVKYADPDTKPTISVDAWTGGVTFSLPNYDLWENIAVAHDTDPFISIYSWIDSYGFYAKLSDPATKPTGSATGVAFSWPYLPSPPTFVVATPDSSQRNETLDIVITGSDFLLVSDVDFVADIIVNSFVVDSAGQITVNITIDIAAALGLRDISVTTPYGTEIRGDLFTIMDIPPSSNRAVGSLAAKMLVMFGR